MTDHETLPETVWPSGAPDSMPPASEDLVAGRYAILELAGTGAMGSVYRAHDRELDEIVALKTIRQEVASVPGFLESLRLEVKLARKVTHRNVARVFDIGEHAGVRFLSMEFLEGETLATWIRPGGIAVAEAVDLVLPICDALEAAHAAGVVHRDLKPENVVVASDGRVTVTDFGVACLAEERGMRGSPVDVLVGTPAYMAPEQVLGSADLDGRADIYAVGLILFELLTGSPAFDGETPVDVARARLLRPPPSLAEARPDLPLALVAVVERALALCREERFSSARDLAAALTDAAALARPAVEPAGKEASRRAEAAAKHVAVLPFRALSGAPSDATVADGLSQDLIAVISMTRGLRVRPRSSVAAVANGAEPDLRAIGEALGVAVVVDGSVQRIDDTFTVTVRMRSTSDGLKIWSGRFRKPVRELLELNDAVARAVCAALATKIDSRPRIAPDDPRAIEAYLRGGALVRRGWYRLEDVEEGVRLLEVAAALAPSDPSILAAFALGRARLVFLDRTDPVAARRRASETARRAVSIAPHLGEAWLALGSVHVYEGASAKAVPTLVRAMRAAPSLARAREMLGRLLVEAGLLGDGRSLLEAALALDPMTFTPRWDIVQAHALSGQWDQVQALLALAVADPGSESARSLLRARFAVWQGANDASRERPRRTSNRPVSELGPEPRHGDPASVLARAFWHVAARGSLDAGVRRELDVLLRPAIGRVRRLLLQFDAELRLASADPAAGDALAAAVDAGFDDQSWLDGCPLLAPLRRDPRWPAWHAAVADRARRVRIAWAGSSVDDEGPASYPASSRGRRSCGS